MGSPTKLNKEKEELIRREQNKANTIMRREERNRRIEAERKKIEEEARLLEEELKRLDEQEAMEREMGEERARAGRGGVNGGSRR